MLLFLPDPELIILVCTLDLFALISPYPMTLDYDSQYIRTFCSSSLDILQIDSEYMTYSIHCPNSMHHTPLGCSAQTLNPELRKLVALPCTNTHALVEHPSASTPNLGS